MGAAVRVVGKAADGVLLVLPLGLLETAGLIDEVVDELPRRRILHLLPFQADGSKEIFEFIINHLVHVELRKVMVPVETSVADVQEVGGFSDHVFPQILLLIFPFSVQELPLLFMLFMLFLCRRFVIGGLVDRLLRSRHRQGRLVSRRLQFLLLLLHPLPHAFFSLLLAVQQQVTDGGVKVLRVRFVCEVEADHLFVRFELMEMRSRIVIRKLPVDFLLEDPLARREVVNLDEKGLADVVFGKGGHPAVDLVPAAMVRWLRPVHLHHSRCLCQTPQVEHLEDRLILLLAKFVRRLVGRRPRLARHGDTLVLPEGFFGLVLTAPLDANFLRQIGRAHV